MANRGSRFFCDAEAPSCHQATLIMISVQLNRSDHRVCTLLGETPFGFLKVYCAIDKCDMRKGLRVVP